MSQASMRDYINAVDKQAFDRLDRMSNDEILSKSVDDWIDDFVGKALPDIPEFFRIKCPIRPCRGRCRNIECQIQILRVMCPWLRG